MKTVEYKSKETGLVSAVFLIGGDNGDLLLIPKSKSYECPCLILCEHNYRESYYDGDDNSSWTNVEIEDLGQLNKTLTELKKNKWKIKEDKEYELYLKLKAKYEQKLI